MTAKPLDGPELRAIAHELIDSLAEIRRQLLYSQRHLARRIGISQPGISKFETHQASPNFETVLRYADAVGVDITLTMRRNSQ